jgi:formyl-CoA transferase
MMTTELGGLPLDGVMVLDFTRVLAGPFCTMLLGDLGAEVIKVEPPDGDETRQWGPPFAADGTSAYYLCANRNKRSITLNLKHPEAQRIARELADRAQVVVENFKPGGMARFGLDQAALRARKPALVYASITGYGQTGAYRDRPGYDFVIQAQSGLMAITGEVNGAPMKVGVAICDVIAGLFAAASILAALYGAQRTGIGRYLDIALLDTAAAALVNVAAGALISGDEPKRCGSAHPNIVPYQPFMASDRLFALAVGNDRQFRALCALIGHAEWAEDARFATNRARVVNREALIPLLEAVFAEKPAAVWIEACLAAGVPAGEVSTVGELLASEQIAARGLIREIDLNGMAARILGSPVHLDGAPPPVRLPPPKLGADTDAVLRDKLGLSAAAVSRLRALGAV